MKTMIKRAVALLVVCLMASSAAASAVLYRFKNENGDPVYSYTLPPEQARSGYEKIDARSGQILESVAPQLPPRELAEKLRREQAMQACRDELQRIYQLYGSESDIQYAREDAIESLDDRISQLQANLRQARREQDRLRAQAADAERGGREIPQRLMSNLERSQSQINTLEGEVEQRRVEQRDAEVRYDRDLARFRHGRCPEPGTVAGVDH